MSLARGLDASFSYVEMRSARIVYKLGCLFTDTIWADIDRYNSIQHIFYSSISAACSWRIDDVFGLM